MQYDLVVVGAGIQGVGVAQAAAAAGYSVLVVEQHGVASATSSKSSKLIHGGLRYLESGQIGLVRESLRERAILLKNAPSLVKLEPLHIPVYQHSSRASWKIRTGLSLYALLGGLGEANRFSSLAPEQWQQLSGLKQQGLKAVYQYYEAQTDDAALTRAVLASAVSLGAETAIPARFIAAERRAGSCVVHLESQGAQHSVETRALINCGGPWANQVISGVQPAMATSPVELVQGSHLLLPPLLKQYFYLESPSDRRAIFVLPWQGQLLVGTTETPHHEAPELSHCLASEQAYLLETLAFYFPDIDVAAVPVNSFAGLRVLPRSDKAAFSRSREVLISVDDELRPLVLSVMGGKLTTYRATALLVMRRLKGVLPRRTAQADTASLPLG